MRAHGLGAAAVASRPTAGIRTVDVVPPSASGESRVVFRAAAAIVFGALFVIGVHARDGGPAGELRAADLAPFQVLFRDAPPAAQRTYRELQEGLIEAENVRAATRRWPAVATLAAQGIPPFAPPARGGRDAQSGAPIADYRWTVAQEGIYVNYLGVPPPGSGAPAFLALVQEPEPGYVETTSPAAPPDELHHRLADGTLLHVSIWMRAGGVAADDPTPITRPFASGWTQILVGRQGA